MADILKFMHCGCEYTFCSTNGPSFPADIFGDGSDGDCHITFNRDTNGHVTIPAQEYNFCNLCIDECVTLHFCGDGVPVIKVKENFVNNGTIQLRNPLLCASYEEYIQGLGKVVHNKCNYCYRLACAYYNCNRFTLENLSGVCAAGGYGNSSYGGGDGGTGGAAGQSGSNGCGGTSNTKGTGGTSAYQNAGGGGGGGGSYSCCTYTSSPTDGCPAGDGIGGDGGDAYLISNYNCFTGTGGGGGGGYGFYKGGKGGDSIRCAQCNCGFAGGLAGNGGNSYAGDGGDGGRSYAKNCSGYMYGVCDGGNGGDSYWGNGGNMGSGSACSSGCHYGGSTIYGNGGKANVPSNTNYFSYYCGGNSLFGNGGEGGIGGNGLDGGKGMSEGGVAWGGVYGLGLFANNIENNGAIFGRGGDGGGSYCSGAAKCGTDGAEIYIVVGCEYCNAGEISCRAGLGGTSTYSGQKMSDGEAGFVKFYHI